MARRSFLGVALMIPLMLAGAAARAQVADTGELGKDWVFSTGIMYGQSRSHFDSGSVYGIPDIQNKSGGYFTEFDFHRHFGVQLSYWWLANNDLPDFSSGGTSYYAVSREVSGFSVLAVGLLPVGNVVKLTGKLGALFWRGETTACSDLFCNNFEGTTISDDSGVSLAYGVGVRFDLARYFGIRLDYDAYPKVDNARMQTLSAGIYFRY